MSKKDEDVEVDLTGLSPKNNGKHNGSGKSDRQEVFFDQVLSSTTSHHRKSRHHHHHHNNKKDDVVEPDNNLIIKSRRSDLLSSYYEASSTEMRSSTENIRSLMKQRQAELEELAQEETRKKEAFFSLGTASSNPESLAASCSTNFPTTKDLGEFNLALKLPSSRGDQCHGRISRRLSHPQQSTTIPTNSLFAPPERKRSKSGPGSRRGSAADQLAEEANFLGLTA